MRRFVAIFLLMLLPLQSIWAAAAVYCQHEEAAAGTHVGHHTHEHHSHAQPHGKGQGQGQGQVDADAPSSSSDQGAALDHADCHVFHAGCSPLSEMAFNCHLRQCADRLFAESVAALPWPPLSRPERPNWPALA